MAQAQYPYLDLTVLPQIRPHLISASAALLFDATVSDVLWANGEGAGLIGAANVRAALEGSIKPNPAMMRQIRTAVEKLETDEESAAVLRLRQGFKTRIVGFSVREITLPQGEKSILLLSERLHGRGHDENDMAQAAVDGLDGYSHASAILDDHGKIVAASQHFEALEVSSDVLEGLVEEVATETDRLVKRPIDTARGKLPAGIARLSENPSSHVLIIADGGETSLSTPSAPDEKSDAPEPAVSTVENESTSGDEPDSAGPTIGAFSNKRAKIGANGLGRWYYKQTASSDDADVVEDKGEASPLIEAKETEDEAEAFNSANADSGLIQDVVASADASPESQKTEETSAPESGSAESETSDDHDGFRFISGSKPVRFVWDVDAEQTFRSVSTELANTVGPKAAHVEGLTWKQVSSNYALENGGEIARLFEKGDTWSGKTVLWPVEGTDLRVPIDLAGLPSYDRNRNLEGFNGFGIIRTSDAMLDPKATGLSLYDEGEQPPAIENADTAEDTRPGPEDNVDNEASTAGQIVDLQARRDQKNGRTLSSDESENFKEIGDKLSDVSETEADDKGKENAFLPSAFAGGARFNKQADNEAPTVSEDDVQSTSVGTPEHDVDTSILSRLPIPVLVYRENDLLFGNGEFFAVTGYEDLKHLAKAGGISALYGGPSANDAESHARIYHADGTQLNHHAHLQRVPWDDDHAMLLTLRQGSKTSGDKGNPTFSASVDPDQTENESSKADHDKVGDYVLDDAPQNVDGNKSSANNATIIPLHGSNEQTGSSTPSLTGANTPELVQAFGGLEAQDLRHIIDTATDGVIILSDEGVVRAINKSAEALFDVESEDIRDRSITRVLAPESHRSAMDYLSGMSGTGVASLMNDGREIIGKTSKGGLIPLFMTMGKLEKTDACCVVLRDITQWKKAEEELLTAKTQAENASAQKTEFLAKVSHEIRTPLNAIIGFSDLMIEERFGKIDNDRYRGYLRDIHRSGTHVLDLINDLLDISKIEAGKVDLEFDACDLNTTVSETVALSQPDANKERIIIRTSLSAVVPKVVADPRSLKQIILNLVSNSIKYTKSGGQVIVSTVYEESGEVVLRVRDTGIGMSEADLNQALKPFQQVNAETNTQGTGLGLPLTKALVEANRARFEIESTPDEGTLVEIYFPNQRVLADR